MVLKGVPEEASQRRLPRRRFRLKAGFRLRQDFRLRQVFLGVRRLPWVSGGFPGWEITLVYPALYYPGYILPCCTHPAHAPPTYTVQAVLDRQEWPFWRHARSRTRSS